MPKREPLSRPRTARGGQETLFRVSSAAALAAAVGSLLLFLLVLRCEPGSSLRSAMPTQAESKVLGAGAEVAVTPTGGPPAFLLPTTDPGIVPDLVMQHGIVAVATLRAAEMPYIVIQVENEDLPSGTVFLQSPTAGTKLEENMVVSLLASR